MYHSLCNRENTALSDSLNGSNGIISVYSYVKKDNEKGLQCLSKWKGEERFERKIVKGE